MTDDQHKPGGFHVPTGQEFVDWLGGQARAAGFPTLDDLLPSRRAAKDDGTTGDTDEEPARPQREGFAAGLATGVTAIVAAVVGARDAITESLEDHFGPIEGGDQQFHVTNAEQRERVEKQIAAITAQFVAAAGAASPPDLICEFWLLQKLNETNAEPFTKWDAWEQLKQYGRKAFEAAWSRVEKLLTQPN